MKLREFITHHDGEEVRVTLPESLAQRVDNGDTIITIKLRSVPARPAPPRQRPAPGAGRRVT